jgi:HlyD family secretion protein/epimerase transport system membrane fusion protein
MLGMKLLGKLAQVPADESGEATRLVRSGLFFWVLLFVGFLIWGSLAPIQGAVISSGTIKIDLNRRTVQHLEGGIIKEILVREGSRVEKGQSLITLEDISTSSQLAILSDRLFSNKVKEVRLNAQKRKRKNLNFPEEIASKSDSKSKKTLASEVELFNSKRKSLIDQIKLLKFEIKQTQRGLEGGAQQMMAIKSGIGFVRKQLESTRKLRAKGYVEDSKIWEQERLLAEKKEKIGSLLAQQATARISITDTKLKIITLENNYIQEADDQLKETERELLEIRELLRPAKYAFDRAAVVAPLSGQVINIKVNTIGGIIHPGEDILEIVPDIKELIIEAKLKTSDIDSVITGQLANIQLLAYSSRKTPMLTGKVVYISEDVIEDTIERGAFYYLCHIKVSEESLSELPAETLLLPGMPITAFIQTRAKTFIDFVLEPIISHARRALKED